MSRWFLVKNKQKLGPYSAAEMRRLAADRQLQPNDMVLREGDRRWVEARAVRGLLPETNPVSSATSTVQLWRRPAFWLFLLFLIPCAASAWFYLQARTLRVLLHVQQQRIGELDTLAAKQKETIAELEARLARFKDSAAPAKIEASLPPSDVKPSEPQPKAIPQSQPFLQPKAAPLSFAEIDRHALAARREAESTLKSLAAYLTAPAATDLLKVRAIFRWVTDRISYNLEALQAQKMPDYQPEAVLAARTSVCEGYARLFEALCKEAKVEVALIHGFGKTQALVGPDGSNRITHTWNAVKLDGRWRLLDTTWGAGSIHNGAYLKKLNEFYFLTPPDQFVFAHFPNDPKWQLLDKPVPASEFEKQPLVAAELFQMGITTAEVEKHLHGKNFPGFVKTFLHTPLIRLRSGPLAGTLAKDKSRTFTLESPTALAMAFFSNGRYTAMLTKKGDVFTGSIAPPAGTLHVGVRTPASGTRFDFVLEYRVE